METIDILRIVWFFLIGLLLIVYGVLDGFDLGIGALFPFLGKTEEDKSVLVNTVGPFWDGNEVWLLTGGGALFAAFPEAYATVFSGFYLALMVVLFSLILRAVSLEYRHLDTKRKGLWEWVFTITSLLPALLVGVALGNVIVGVPLDANFEFQGNFFTLLRPFPLSVGLLGLSMILLQGSTMTILKATGDLKERALQLSEKLFYAVIALAIITLVLSAICVTGSIKSIPAWVGGVIFFVLAGLLFKYLKDKGEAAPFFLSSGMFLSLGWIAGSIHFPNMVKGIGGKNSLTIYNASSSQLTLTVMLIIAIIGMPIVIGYSIYIYRVFKGKVSPDSSVY